MTDKDMVSKTEVLNIYAELYDEFIDAPGIIEVLHKVYDKINCLQSSEPVIVKCKNCKFWFDAIRCQMYSEGMLTDGNWFCADGERK